MALLALGARLLGGAAKKLLPKAGRWIGRAVSGAAKRPATTAAIGGAVLGAVTRGRALPAPPGFAPIPQGGPPRPAGLPTRIGQRIVPGGMTGREMTPYAGTEYDKRGWPIAVYPETRERLYAPPGYVIVRTRDGEPVAMLKGAARAMGLWKAPPKPPVSGWDMRAIQRAKAAQKRVKKLAGAVGYKCASKGSR